MIDRIVIENEPATWYTSYMPSDEREKRSETVSAKVYPSVKAFVGELMEQERRTESQIILWLLERGIAQYNRDGLLSEPDQKIPGQKIADSKPQRRKLKTG